jgi:transposase
LADAACDFVAFRLSAGQAHDNPHLLPLLDGHLRQTGIAATDIRLLCDKAYTGRKTRSELRKRRIKHVIPEKRNEKTARKRKGSKGGRPPGFDTEIYKWRNTVERANNRIKQWRGIATRYDKYALTFLGGVILAGAIMVDRTASRN